MDLNQRLEAEVWMCQRPYSGVLQNGLHCNNLPPASLIDKAKDRITGNVYLINPLEVCNDFITHLSC
jgi:hypothetical protein